MPPTSPKVTVLISTYNRPEYLHDAVQSVIDQTMRDWELIVMNDGGVDVGHIVERFNDSRIRYLNDDVNRGVAARFNIGIREARGEYIAYNGDDDILYPNHLDVLYKTLQANPHVQVAYTNPYHVVFAVDKETGRRFPLEKRVIVSRDFNRNLMFTINLAAHGCLMHSRELALRVGGYDEDVRVLVDWNLTRKMTYFTDFVYIPELTIEGWIPFEKSDRITDRERKNQESFKHNLRKIMADHPAEPWPYVEKVAVVFPVRNWDEAAVGMIVDFLDTLCYPLTLIIVNLSPEEDAPYRNERAAALLALKNVKIFRPEHTLSDMAAYRFGARHSDATYVYLPSFSAVKGLQVRLFAALDLIKRTGAKAVDWDIQAERKSVFDVLVDREAFLNAVDDESDNINLKRETVPRGTIPWDFRIDNLIAETNERINEGDFIGAHRTHAKLMSITESVRHVDSVLMSGIFRLLMRLEKYREAEKKCRDLIDRGYGADNWIRLGRVLQKTDRLKDAIRAYSNGLYETGLKPEHLSESVFPLHISYEPHSYNAIIGLAECFIDTGDLDNAANMLRLAARLMDSNHRTALGYARLFAALGNTAKAEEMLVRILRSKDGDEEVLEHLGRLYERKGDMESAYRCYSKSFNLIENQKTAALVYRAGSKIGRWVDMKSMFEKWAEKFPLNIKMAFFLASVYGHEGDLKKAEFWLEQGLLLDAKSSELAALKKRIAERNTSISFMVNPRELHENNPGITMTPFADASPIKTI